MDVRILPTGRTAGAQVSGTNDTEEPDRCSSAVKHLYTSDNSCFETVNGRASSSTHSEMVGRNTKLMVEKLMVGSHYFASLLHTLTQLSDRLPAAIAPPRPASNAPDAFRAKRTKTQTTYRRGSLMKTGILFCADPTSAPYPLTRTPIPRETTGRTAATIY